MKRAGLTITLVVVILILLAGVGYAAVRRGGLLPGSVIKDSGDNVSDYSAVFLTNGQVYFGKVNKMSDTTVDISDIFYLQVNQQIQASGTSASPSPSPSGQPNIVLVKLGEELHGPNDLMHINRDQVLFTESMKKDSKVIKAIDDYKAGKK